LPGTAGPATGFGALRPHNPGRRRGSPSGPPDWLRRHYRPDRRLGGGSKTKRRDWMGPTWGCCPRGPSRAGGPPGPGGDAAGPGGDTAGPGGDTTGPGSPAIKLPVREVTAPTPDDELDTGNVRVIPPDPRT